MSNSKLATVTMLTSHMTSPRGRKIDTVTIHCMAGNLTVETCGRVFQSRRASSNYGIGSDGRIALYVDEANRSWATSNSENDSRAVTIEVANDGGAETGWHVSDEAYRALIRLLADICRRNGIRKLRWKGDRNLIGHVDQQNMTAHRWFAAKACPGDYLYNNFGKIAHRVNKRLKRLMAVQAVNDGMVSAGNQGFTDDVGFAADDMGFTDDVNDVINEDGMGFEELEPIPDARLLPVVDEITETGNIPEWLIEDGE